MVNIKTFECFIIDKINGKDVIINDILSNNESINDWWNKFITYGKRGLLTASIVLSIAFSTQAQNNNKTNDVIKSGVELLKDNTEKNNVYSFFVGIATENSSLSMKNGDIDAAGAFKEISKYYQALRDGNKPSPLSSTALKYMKVIEKISNKISDTDITHFINFGKSIQTID